MIKLFFAFFMIVTANFAQTVGSLGGDAWVESGQMLRYPTSRFFTAVGVGASERAARENAVVEVKRQISASIDSRAILRETRTAVNNVESETTVFDERSRITTSGDIEGVQIIATATREGRFFAFAALEKENFIAHQRMKISELRTAVIEAERQARGAMAGGRVSLALAFFNTAADRVAQIQAERALLSAAVTLGQEDELPISFAQISAGLASLAATVRISAQSEESQTVFAEKASSLEFLVSVTSNEKPAENLRVFLFNEAGEKTANALTASDGTARLTLGDDAPTDRATHRFTAKIEWGDDFLGEAAFAYTVQTRDLSARITVSVSNDLRSGRAEIERAAIQMLATHGIIHNSRSCARISVDVSDVLGERIDGITATRTFVRSTAQAQISVLDASGAQMFSTNISQLAMANQRTGAVVEAIRNMRLGVNLVPTQNAIFSLTGGAESRCP